MQFLLTVRGGGAVVHFAAFGSLRIGDGGGVPRVSWAWELEGTCRLDSSFLGRNISLNDVISKWAAKGSILSAKGGPLTHDICFDPR